MLESEKVSIEDMDLDPDYILTQEQQEYADDALRAYYWNNQMYSEFNALNSKIESRSQGRSNADAQNLSNEQEIIDRK